MTGTIDLLQRCYPGLQASAEALVLDPVLPDEITGLRLSLSYRGHRLGFRIGHDEVTVTSAPARHHR